jgi:hypothetical protein
LPVTGSGVFGREEDIAFLDRAWANKDVKVVTFIVFRESNRERAGIGGSTGGGGLGLSSERESDASLS